MRLPACYCRRSTHLCVRPMGALQRQMQQDVCACVCVHAHLSSLHNKHLSLHTGHMPSNTNLPSPPPPPPRLAFMSFFSFCPHLLVFDEVPGAGRRSCCTSSWALCLFQQLSFTHKLPLKHTHMHTKERQTYWMCQRPTLRGSHFQ